MQENIKMKEAMSTREKEVIKCNTNYQKCEISRITII